MFDFSFYTFPLVHMPFFIQLSASSVLVPLTALCTLLNHGAFGINSVISNPRLDIVVLRYVWCAISNRMFNVSIYVNRGICRLRLRTNLPLCTFCTGFVWRLSGFWEMLIVFLDKLSPGTVTEKSELKNAYDDVVWWYLVSDISHFFSFYTDVVMILY